MIYLATIPDYYRTRKGVSMIVKGYNLACNPPGSGNRAARRRGLHVSNPDHMKPWGGVGMDRGQVAEMMRRPV